MKIDSLRAAFYASRSSKCRILMRASFPLSTLSTDSRLSTCATRLPTVCRLASADSTIDYRVSTSSSVAGRRPGSSPGSPLPAGGRWGSARPQAMAEGQAQRPPAGRPWRAARPARPPVGGRSMSKGRGPGGCPPAPPEYRARSTVGLAGLPAAPVRAGPVEFGVEGREEALTRRRRPRRRRCRRRGCRRRQLPPRQARLRRRPRRPARGRASYP